MSPKDPKNLDWMQEDPFFKNLFPIQNLKEQLELNPNDVDQYIEEAIKKATGDFIQSPSTLRHEFVDTHNQLIAKIQIPGRIHPENIWLQVNRTHLKVNGLGKEKSQLITLPTAVIPSQAKASFKQGSLQVRMPKMAGGKYREVYIRYL